MVREIKNPKLHSLLTNAGINKKALCERTGLSDVAIYKIFNGSQQHRSFAKYWSVARVLRMSLDHLAIILLSSSPDTSRKLITEFAEKAGIPSLRQLCKLTGGNVFELFNEKVQHTQLHTYRKIADALNISLEHLASVLISDDTTGGVLTKRSELLLLNSLDRVFNSY